MGDEQREISFFIILIKVNFFLAIQTIIFRKYITTQNTLIVSLILK